MDRQMLYDKIYACWLGKNIGGTLGGPVEGRKELMNLTFFPRLSESGEPLPNDDLDLQLVNLHAVEQYGIHLTCANLGQEWAEHVYFPYDEYGYGVTALRLGLRPPFSGLYNNPFIHCMGSPIRSELWAALAHGRPELAVYFAWQDAVVDHADGEGLHGEMFYAALESMAYERSVNTSADKIRLIRDALQFVPATSRTYRAMRDTLKWYEEGVSYIDIREKILTAHGRDNFTDVPQNIAFTMVGFLYGEDFGDGILKAVNLGYDTDCTGATLGALYGILYGQKYIPQEWSAPIGHRITVSAAVRGFEAPADLDELTRRTMLQADLLALTDQSQFHMSDDEKNDFSYQRFVFPEGASARDNICVEIRYPIGASAVPHADFPVEVHFINHTYARWRFSAWIDGGNAFQNAAAVELMLSHGESAVETLTIRAGDLSDARAFHPQLVLRRINDNNVWTDYRTPFAVLRASRWVIDGRETWVDGGVVCFAGHGKHNAETMLMNLKERDCRLMCASPNALQVKLDGEEIIHCPATGVYMPAFHRCPKEQGPVVHLSAGVHRVQITCEGDSSYFMLATLATAKNSEPGAYYCYTDMIIGL